MNVEVKKNSQYFLTKTTYLYLLAFFSNFLLIYIFTQYLNSQNFKLRSFLYRSDDLPSNVGGGNPPLGEHYFGDMYELIYFSNQLISKNINFFDFEIQYPPSAIIFFNFLSNFNMNILIILLVIVSTVLFWMALNHYKLPLSNFELTLLFFIFSKPFLFSIDRGNIEFFTFCLFFYGLSNKKNNIVSIIFITFAALLKPSVLLFVIFLKFKKFFVIVASSILVNLLILVSLDINLAKGSIHYINSINSFINPNSVDQIYTNYSFWNLLSGFRHSDVFLDNFFGDLMQGVLNYRNYIFFLILLFLVVFTKLNGINIFINPNYLIFVISSILLFRTSTGGYSMIYLSIAVICFLKENNFKLTQLFILFNIVVIYLPIPLIRIFNEDPYYSIFSTVNNYFSAFSLFCLFIFSIFNLLNYSSFNKNTIS